MNWFRVYTEARNDAKLRSLSDAQHRVWFNLLCFAAEQPVRGTIASPLTVLAIEVANGDRALVVDTLNALQVLNCVTVSPGNALVTPCNAPDGVTGVTERYMPVTVVFRTFEKRQHIKPSDEKDRIRQRVAKHRKLKSYTNGSMPDVTGNALVTPCNAPTDTDSDTDSERGEDDFPLPPSDPGSQPEEPPDVARLPEFPEGNELLVIESGPASMEPAQARKIFRMLWRAFGNEKICTDFYVHQRRFTFEVWVAAIRKAYQPGKDVTVQSLRYVETIAQGYARNGIPERPSVTPANGQHVLARKPTVGEARVLSVKEQAQRMKEKHGVRRDG